MVTVGLNFMSQPDHHRGTGRLMYTKTYEMPAIPQVGEGIGSAGGVEDFLPGPVVAVTWVLSIGALACHSTGAQAGRTLIRHDFTDSAEGWIVNGDTRPADAIRPAPFPICG